MMTGTMPEGPQNGRPRQDGQGEHGPWRQQYPGAQGAQGAGAFGGPDAFGGPGGGNQPPRKNRTGLIIGLVIAAIAFFLVIVLVVVIAIAVGLGRGGEGGGRKNASPEEQVTAIAQDYMDALAAGDPKPALELVSQQGTNGAVALDEEYYAKALEKAPVKNVSVGTPTMTTMEGEVTVEYTVGDEQASAKISANDYDDDGTYEQTTGVDYDTRVPTSFEGLKPTLNGAEVEADTSVVLLPGAYEAGISNEYFDLDGAETFTFASADSDVEWPEPELNDDGQKEFRTAVQSSVDTCLKQKTLKAGCGMGDLSDASTDGWKITEDTVERSLPDTTQRTIDKMEATPDSEEPTYVTGTSVGTVDTKVTCTKGGQSGTCELLFGGGMGTPSVDLADEKHPVTWD
ncbi:hypothetical protein DEO23_06200 [Brachybacterium endophyticum]|uniref:Uncharacterized protein n=1 Tax=Brachybacterium endophyticum TaxID=2182385 RepID=A0A2U2RL30_9MICO|nr:hypothetical protein [Brachybacterium endophyticum]PWH06546.1 hypothetical protein DEO23_06200 [Brachybacterium endophyticum]